MFLWRSRWSWAHGLVVGDGEKDEVIVQSKDQAVEGMESEQRVVMLSLRV